MNTKKIYLDYAATTPIDPRVLALMLPYLKTKFGNTSSLHSFGREAQAGLEESRQIIADAIGVQEEEIFFTASATESNNTVLKGIAFANKDRGKHIIISSVEHDCVLESSRWLEKQGWEITRLPVDKYGMVNPADVKKAIRKDTILVSVMHANNEIGTLEPIEQIGKICREAGVWFHTDAAQSFGKIPINVNTMNIDLLTASSHKLYGPKGAALLYIKKGVKIEPLLQGGGHERGMRSSTVNVAAIVGFAQATKLCLANMNQENKKITALRDKLIKGILTKIPNTFLNGHPKLRLANNVNIRFAGIEGEGIMMHLDNFGIAVSTGSACSSNTLRPSHVLTACGLKPGQIHGSIRFSLGRWTTEKEINYVLKILPGIIKKLRSMSPFGAQR
jgi:cysteine desulfurase